MRSLKNDPQFAQRMEHFAFKETIEGEDQFLPAEIRWLSVLACLMGCQGVDAYRELLPAALKEGLQPEEIKEMVYQGADYLGLGRILPFLNATNKIFTEEHIELPSAGNHTTTMEDRLEKGIEAQVEIFGEQMREAWKTSVISRWLAANCFGDYYTRTGLTLAQRELITFCFLLSQGGCEPQLKAHIKGNLNLGNDKELLMKIVRTCIPYIGYPRCLNAVNCIEQTA